MEIKNLNDIFYIEKYYDNTFMNQYDENNKFIHLKDEREEKFEDIFKGVDNFSLYQMDNNFDKDKTYYITDKNNKQNNTKEIFMIQKIKKEKIKKKGRRNSKETFLFESKHDKNSSDNIRKKIKRQFIKSIIKYINQLYIKYLPQKNKELKILIYKIIPDFCNASKNR